jgi:AbrB family looped-hinge helix DNA binding protein
MELAKLTSKGQITIPQEIRKKLNLKQGDKVIFYEEDGKIYFQNSSLIALSTIQDEMKGKAEKAGFKDPGDVTDFIKKIRKTRKN